MTHHSSRVGTVPQPYEGRSLDVRAVDAVADLVACVIARELGLPDREPPSVDSMSLGSLLSAARNHRVTGLLLDQSQELGLPEELHETLLADWRAQTYRSMLTASKTADIHGVLLAAGTPHVFVKGAALAALTTGRPTARGVGDIDLLVAASDVYSAHAALAASGYQPCAGCIPAPGLAWRIVAWSHRELWYQDAASKIDIHWRLADQVHLFPPTERLIARRQWVPLGTSAVPTLSDDDSLALACHALYEDGHPTLRSMVDIARLLHSGAGIPRDATMELRRLVADATALTHHVLGTAPSARVALLPLWERSRAQRWPGTQPKGLAAQALRSYRRQARYDRLPSGVVRFAVGCSARYHDMELGPGLCTAVRMVSREAAHQWRERGSRRSP